MNDAITPCGLHSHRPYLLRMARRRLSDPALAEDAVHDVFEAVLAQRAHFAGRSSVRTWLTGILLHKVTDLQRQSARWQPLPGAYGEGEEAESAWDRIASDQPGPLEQAEQRQRLAQVLARIERLPQALREVVQGRLLEDEPTESLCSRLGISADNLFVRLHRARKQLAAA